MTDVEKLTSARKELELTQAQMAELLGLDRSYVSQLENGAKAIQEWVIERVEVLLEARRMANVEKATVGKLQEDFKGTGFRLDSPPVARLVPVVSFARAGEDGFDYEDLANQIDDRVETTCRHPNCFALIVDNDSMEPKYPAGEILVIEPHGELRNGDLVVARLRESGGVLFKRFHWADPKLTRVRLTSYNEIYPALEYPFEDFRFIHPVYQRTTYFRR